MPVSVGTRALPWRHFAPAEPESQQLLTISLIATGGGAATVCWLFAARKEPACVLCGTVALLTGGASGTISRGILSGILTGTGAAFVASLLPIAVAVLPGLVE